jgi:dethiobiotin synthetase
MRVTITGTDTEIGKSLTTACLAAAARSRGREVLALKPLASGIEPGTPGEDATRIARAAGHAPLVHATYALPISPHRAQLREGRSLDPDRLWAWLDGHRAELVLVEGAGGWRVPLGVGPDGSWFEVVDLARRVGGPVVVVAADRLGVLNHTRLTVEAIRRDGLTVAGVVLNRLPGGGDDASRASNLEDLRALLDVPIATLPALDPDDHEALARAGAPVLDALGLDPGGAPETC